MAKRKSRARKKPTAPPAYNGDHGTGTAASVADTFIEPIKNDDGSNPNNMARRRRRDALSGLGLSMRQQQAGEAIRDRYSAVEALSSGSPLKAKVDASPKPDAVVASQIEAQSRWVEVTRGIPGDARAIVDHVCCANQPIWTAPGPLTEGGKKAVLKVALDLVANRLRY